MPSGVHFSNRLICPPKPLPRFRCRQRFFAFVLQFSKPERTPKRSLRSSTFNVVQNNREVRRRWNRAWAYLIFFPRQDF